MSFVRPLSHLFFLSVWNLVILHSAVGQPAPRVPVISIVSQEGSLGLPLKRLLSPAVVVEGGKVVLSADAEGAAPMSFRWFKNGTLLDWATNAAVVLDPLELSDEGDYSVAVRNAFGATHSEPVGLFVSNVRPSQYVSLTVGPVAAANGQVYYSDSLDLGANWTPLNSLFTGLESLFITDLPGSGRRFYRAAGTNALSARIVSGWSQRAPIGAVYSIESLDPAGTVLRWQPLARVTNTQPSLTYVDDAAPNSMARHYRLRTVSVPTKRRAGRLLSTVAWVLPPEVYAQLKEIDAEEPGEIGELGVSFNDAEHSIQFPTNPVPGYWVVVGDQRVVTDTDGGFQIDVPDGATGGYIVRSFGNSRSEAEDTFEISQLVNPGEEILPLLLRYQRSGDLNMDALDTAASSGQPHLADVQCGNPAVHVGNLVSCCLDYDGYVPTDCKDPAGTDVWHYIGSTCFSLVNAGLCFREHNSHAIGHRIPGLRCYDNHKYRNCQNVDLNPSSGFRLTAASAAVECGKTIRILVHNNSAANETEFSLGGRSWKGLGTLSGSRVVARSPWAYTLRHYEDTASRPFHVEDDVILYTAPGPEELPSGFSAVQVQIQGRAGATVQTLDILVTCGRCEDIVPIPNMVTIPPGTFMMGSPESELGSFEDEVMHQVTISRGFRIGRYEVTQGEYLAVVGVNPSVFTGDLNLPVENVTWSNCVAYCEALTTRERNAGRLSFTYRYRLPTEAEWEYACRAGTTTPFHHGDALRHGMGNFLSNAEYPPCEWSGGDHHNMFCINLSARPLYQTAPVGRYAPNAWGLYDVHGNVSEWCSDWYGAYPTSAVIDPQGPEWAGWEDRAYRGGNCFSFAMSCRSAARSGPFHHPRDPFLVNPGGITYLFDYYPIGFRVVLDACPP